MKLSEVKVSVILNWPLCSSQSEDHIVISARKHDQAKQFFCRQAAASISFYSIYEAVLSLLTG